VSSPRDILFELALARVRGSIPTHRVVFLFGAADGRSHSYERISSLPSKARVSSPRDILFDLALARGRGSIPDGGYDLFKYDRYVAAVPNMPFCKKNGILPKKTVNRGKRKVLLQYIFIGGFFCFNIHFQSALLKCANGEPYNLCKQNIDRSISFLYNEIKSNERNNQPRNENAKHRLLLIC